ncbi:hypothetical protein ScPMuIL_004459 [Solemya velum]
MQAAVRDNGSPQRDAVRNANIVITVLHNNFPPVFQNEPYSTIIPDTTRGDVSIYQTSATDNDLQAPYNTVTYEMVGDAVAPTLFYVNVNTGEVRLRDNAVLSLEDDSVYYVQIRAKDGGIPAKDDYATVKVTVLKNNFPPIFDNLDFIRLQIFETFTIGGVVTDVNATDADDTVPENVISYSIIGDNQAPEYFIINPQTGVIRLAKSVLQPAANFYRIQVQAKDGGSPSRTDTTFVEVTVLRDSGQLAFTLPSYSITISESLPVGQFVLTTLAQPGNPVYEVLGFAPGTDYFDLDANSGTITVRQNLRNDPDETKSYQLLVKASATSGVGSLLTDQATVTIIVIRNENGPIFIEDYNRATPDTTPVGTTILTVQATDADGDQIFYTMADSNLPFFLHPRSGAISLAQSVLGTSQDTYSFTVTASDNQSPAKTDTATVTITILRDTFPPEFLSEPYTAFISENSFNSPSVYTVSARDRDIRGQLVFQAIGIGKASIYFDVDDNTGRVFISDSQNLRQDIETSYTLRLIVYDSVYPDVQDTADVTIIVSRNPNSPVCSQSSYNINIAESTSLGDLLIDVNGTDADGHTLTYAITGDERALQYYYINPQNGYISLKSVLTTSSHLTDTITVQLTDNGYPPRSGTCTVQLSVSRDQGPPQFVNLPYQTTIDRTIQTGSDVIKTTAVDPNPVGPIRYLLDPVHPYFDVNQVTGYITTKQNIDTDSTSTYYVVVKAYDTAYPNQLATATATIFVTRNPNAPYFSQALYRETVYESEITGATVVEVRAFDIDGDTVVYSMEGDNNDRTYFFLGRTTGDITLSRSLFGNNINQFQFDVVANDQGSPDRSARAQVIIDVIRDEAPYFIRLPYVQNIEANRDVGMYVMTVTARDDDLVGNIIYDKTGQDQASYYFDVDPSSGDVTIINSVANDVQTTYKLTVTAVDSGSPNYVATSTVTINIQRNPSGPQFTLPSYETLIPETYLVGGNLINTTAVDTDGDQIEYSLISSIFNDDYGLQFFFINPRTGRIFLGKPLTEDQLNTARFTMRVRATDGGTPERTAVASVIVNVNRNRFPPVFTNTPYIISLSEKEAPQTSIYQVTATDQDLVGSITYSVTGDDIAPYLFSVDKTTGTVRIRTSLQPFNDYTYKLRVVAADTAYPLETTTVTVDITVTRNEGRPVFLNTPYRVTIPEATTIGTCFLNITAIDSDGDKVVYTVLENQSSATVTNYFFLSSDSGRLCVRILLYGPSQKDYTMKVMASDQGSPLQQTTVDVYITVLRDEFPPVFINEPYATVIDTAVSGSSVYRVTAIDNDIEGRIYYELTGDFLAQTYFEINQLTGEITTKIDLFSDNALSSVYLAEVIAYDSARSESRDTSTVTISVIRNANAPIWSQDNYYQQISENTLAGFDVLDLFASDADVGDTVSYSILSQFPNTGQQVFFLAPLQATIRLARNLKDAEISSINQYTLALRACDDGVPQKCANATATIVITRFTCQLSFTQNNYQFSISESTSTNVVVGNIRASANNLVGNVAYELGFTGSALFVVDDNTGAIRLSSDIRFDSNLFYSFSVRAYDSLSTDCSVSATVTIQVNRNPSGPQFLRDPYSTEIPANHILGKLVIATTAIDEDGDIVRYSLLGDVTANEYFYIMPDTGDITLKKSLANTNIGSFSLTIQASDQNIPERTDTASVIVTVTRDNQPPFFLDNYSRTIDENWAIGSEILSVSAMDTDLVNRIKYEATGVFPATQLFSVNEFTGVVTLDRSLREDVITRSSYTLRVIAYDTAYPSARATTDVQINVIRDPNAPIFIPSATYEITIPDSQSIGSSFISVSANDQDQGDIVTYQLINSTLDGTDYFFLDRETGDVKVRSSLVDTSITSYLLTVMANDNRGKTAYATVQIYITRQQDMIPFFINTPYLRVLQPNTPLQNVYDVSARDNDLIGNIRYEITSYYPTSEFFSINPSTGSISLERPISSDQTGTRVYLVFVEAYDTAAPESRAKATVVFQIDTNPNCPSFSSPFYSFSISQNEALTSEIGQVFATDNDGDSVFYTLSNFLNDIEFSSFLFLDYNTGALILRRSLFTAPTSLQFTVIARDALAFPSCTDTATVQINIQKDQFPPQFSLPDYQTTIVETRLVNSTVPIITVQATDSDLEGNIVYEAVGDFAAYSFFWINQNGQIFVKRSLVNSFQDEYILDLVAYDSYYPENKATSKAIIRIIRNPNCPIFSQNSYSQQVNENHAVGAVVTRVTATDADGDTIRYKMYGQLNAEDYFFIGSDTGNIRLRTDLLDGAFITQYTITVEASDQRSPPCRTNTTLTLTVSRGSPPFFINTPYSTVMGENTVPGQSVFVVSAIDQDLQGEIYYSVIGDNSAPSFFEVNSRTGLVSLRFAVDQDINEVYTLRVVAYDTSVPNQRTTSTVLISVPRNPSGPQFIREPYRVTINIKQEPYLTIYTVLAVDSDGDTVYYSMIDEEKAIENEYFYLDEFTGELKLIKVLSENIPSFRIRIRASDRGRPERTDDSEIIVTIDTTVSPPRFQRIPYVATISDTVFSGYNVYQTTAVDVDLRGNIVYEAIGIYPAQNFFEINSQTGLVTTREDLQSDVFCTDRYTLRIIAYDSLVPDEQASTDVTIQVTRNPSAPLFNSPSITLSVDEDRLLGSPITNIEATDRDGNTLAYSLVANNNNNGQALNFFFIDRNNGSLYLQQPLNAVATGVSQFSFQVMVKDSGCPPRSAFSDVTIFITRDQYPPVFVNTPYSAFVDEDVNPGIEVYRITATDADLVDVIVYEVVGYLSAPSFFNVDQDGRIRVRTSLLDDVALTYVLRVEAYDRANPNQRAREDVTINVQRNNNGPIFTLPSYQTRIAATTSPGTEVIAVNAFDADNDALQYFLITDNRCMEMFYMDTRYGGIQLRRSLINTADVFFSCTVSVTDNGYPTPKTATANVRIDVDRVTDPPLFNQNGRYTITIPETTSIGTSIISVLATKQNLLGRVFYDEIGDYPAQSFFAVDDVNGDVTVTDSLQTDSLRLSFFQLRIVAYDTEVPQLTSTALVDITVTRFENPPIFSPSIYTVEIDEDTPIGTYIQKLTVTDVDGNSVVCSMSGGNVQSQRFFGVESDGCLVSVTDLLTNDQQKGTSFTVNVIASDTSVTPALTSQATVYITVIRDRFAPRFTNLPDSVSLQELLAINSTVFAANAVDDDLRGYIVYDLVGVFPCKSYFSINQLTGDIVQRNSFQFDGTQRPSYTCRVEAWDSANPERRITSDLTIGVNRNPSGPIFTEAIYERTISQNYPVGDIVVDVEATDGDGDTIRYTWTGDSEDQEYFYMSSDNGDFMLRKSLMGTNQILFEFRVTAYDNRPSAVQKLAEATVRIRVVQDSGPPRFINTPYFYSVDFNAPSQSTVFRVTAVDNDLQDRIEYRLDGYQPGDDVFSLITNTGEIVLNQPLSANPTINTYHLLVTAYDTAARDMETSETVTITVRKNINAPIFSKRDYETTIYDYLPLGSEVIRVTASDRDITSPENIIIYSLSDNTQYFGVDPNNGIVRVANLLTTDVNRPSRYTMQVIATDRGNPSQTGTANLIVNVIHNDGTPRFLDTQSYFTTVSEGVIPNTVIFTVSAIDLDPVDTPNGQLAYTITGPDEVNRIFRMDVNTGDILPRVSLLTVSEDQYRLNVRVADKGVPSRNDDAVVTVNIRREGLPAFELPTYEIQIPEDTSIESVITTVTAIDPRPLSDLVYIITGEGLGLTLFDVNPSSGMISLKQSLLTDDSLTYIVRVVAYRVTNNDERATTTVRVNVIRNPTSPQFTHRDVTYTISETISVGTLFGDVNATDPDPGRNGELTYYFDENEFVPGYTDQFFYVNPESGKLYIKESLLKDVRNTERYEFVVVARDNGVPTLSADIRVTVIVVGNRNAPVFSLENYEVTVNETISVGQEVVRVVASDGDNDPIEYSIISGPPGNYYFNINQASGALTVDKSLAEIGLEQFTLTVKVTDRPDAATTPKTDVAQVIIHVLRNPNPPIFDQVFYNITISEYAPVNSRVIGVMATDADSSNIPSGTIRYRTQSINFTPDSGTCSVCG